MRALTLLVVLGFLSSGCAIGVQHRYDAFDAKFDVATKSRIAVGVLDLRTYIVSGDKEPNFVGLQRGGFGNPFDVTTASGKSLAEDFANTIVETFEKNEIEATRVPLDVHKKISEGRRALLDADADRYVMLILHEWKSDTYQNVGLRYNVTLNVYGKDGSELAEKTLSGNDNLGGSAWNPPAHSRTAVPNAYRKKLEQLFNDRTVIASLD